MSCSARTPFVSSRLPPNSQFQDGRMHRLSRPTRDGGDDGEIRFARHPLMVSEGPARPDGKGRVGAKLTGRWRTARRDDPPDCRLRVTNGFRRRCTDDGHAGAVAEFLSRLPTIVAQSGAPTPVNLRPVVLPPSDRPQPSWHRPGHDTQTLCRFRCAQRSWCAASLRHRA